MLLIVFLLLFGMITFYVTSSYYFQLEAARDAEDSKLKTVSNTLSLMIKPNEFKNLMAKYDKDGIKANYQDGTYSRYHSLFKSVQQSNDIQSPIYTLSLDKSYRTFSFGITSAEKPYFKHAYTSYPKELLQKYEEGGTLGPYEDEHNIWISAFAPIRDKHGRVLGVVMVDEKFESFIDEVNRQVLITVCISGVIFLLLGFYLYKRVKIFLRSEEQSKHELEISKKLIEEKNRNIVSSINYAESIQKAFLPPIENIKSAIKDSFVLFNPKDIVSGDFYWFTQCDDGKVYLVAADSTGHGVPGALMSMINTAMINDVINVYGKREPGEILEAIDQEIKSAFKGTGNNRDGMDLAIVCVDRPNNRLSYAGAYRPLIHISNKHTKEYKANRFSIETEDSKPKGDYISHEIELVEGDCFYIYSDGFPDQFGGKENVKFMNRTFKQLLKDISHEPMSHQKTLLQQALKDWMGEHSQVDDILVIGFRI